MAMNKKIRPYLLLVVAIVLCAAVLYLDKPGSSRIASEIDSLLFPAFVGDQVEKITIVHLLDGVEITKNGDTWQVSTIETDMSRQMREAAGDTQPAPQSAAVAADPELVREIITLVEKLKVGGVVSHNEHNHNKLQVAGISLQVRMFGKDNHALAYMHVGKQRPDFF